MTAGCGAGPEPVPSAPATQLSSAATSAPTSPRTAPAEPGKGCASGPAAPTKGTRSKPGRIAFAQDGDLYTVEADGGKEENLTGKLGEEAIEKDPAWSPDGRRVAFSGFRGKDFDIYVMDLARRTVKQLTRSAGDEVHPRWSPDGRSLGFDAESDEASAIVVINVDGSGLATLRKGPDSGAIGLADWAPDGSRILFTQDLSSSGGELDIHVMGADGTCARQLTDTSGDDSGARWSPDGEQILFGSNRDDGGLYRMTAEGTGQVRVATAPEDDTGLDTIRPAWSPDGTKIAWTGKYEGDRGTKIYVMKADGTGLTSIHGALDTATVIDWQPLPR